MSAVGFLDDCLPVGVGEDLGLGHLPAVQLVGGGGVGAASHEQAQLAA
jgi:hypothetical protein